jgi:putative endonuclease
MHTRAQIGRRGERLAAGKLEAEGYRVIERNYRTREGELDIVAVRDGTIVFCEVKTLIARNVDRGGPLFALESVNNAKRAQVRRMARSWIADRPRSANARGRPAVRFDAIGVVLSAAGELLRIDHVEAAF